MSADGVKCPACLIAEQTERGVPMLNCYTTDDRLAFQFDDWGDIAEDVATDLGLDADAYGAAEGVLVVLRSTDRRGAYVFSSVVSGDALRDALLAANLIHDTV